MSARSATARPGTSPSMRATTPVFADAAVLDTEGVEFSLDQRGRFVLLEAQFGPAVDCAPQFDNPRG